MTSGNMKGRERMILEAHTKKVFSSSLFGSRMEVNGNPLTLLVTLDIFSSLLFSSFGSGGGDRLRCMLDTPPCLSSNPRNALSQRACFVCVLKEGQYEATIPTVTIMGVCVFYLFLGGDTWVGGRRCGGI